MLTKFLIEVAPKTKWTFTNVSNIIEYVNGKVASYDGIDIPESPMGNPAANSLAFSAVLKTLAPNSIVFSHLRISDMNELLFISSLMAAKIFNIDSVIVTRGDPPSFGGYLSNLTSEEAYNIAKKFSLESKLGAIVSLRYDFENIKRRLSYGFTTYLVLRYEKDENEKLKQIYTFKKKLETKPKIYVYLIVRTEHNRKWLNSFSQPYIELSEIKNIISDLKEFSDGIVFSTLGDLKSMETIFKII